MRKWTSLGPPEYPERYFIIRAPGVDLFELLRDIDLSPLMEAHSGNTTRTDLNFDGKRHFMNPSRFDDFRGGKSCYTFFWVTITAERVVFAENYSTTDGPIFDATQRLIAFLIEQGAHFKWSSYTAYSDSGESSDTVKGTWRDFLDA